MSFFESWEIQCNECKAVESHFNTRSFKYQCINCSNTIEVIPHLEKVEVKRKRDKGEYVKRIEVMGGIFLGYTI